MAIDAITLSLANRYSEKMAATGGVTSEKIKSAVEEYLTNNTVKAEIDKTLSKSNVPADAKTVGDKITEINNNLGKSVKNILCGGVNLGRKKIKKTQES